jgi:hypothetical protein
MSSIIIIPLPFATNVALMRRPFLLFPHYFTDHSAVNLIIIKYLFINGGTLFPAITKFGQKFQYLKYNCKKVANLFGNFFIPISKDWSKIIEK